jgi:hypothetical protein
VLSALSADDRVRLTRWLALLCAAAAMDAREVADLRLARIDAALAAGVAAAQATLGERVIAAPAGAVAAGRAAVPVTSGTSASGGRSPTMDLPRQRLVPMLLTLFSCDGRKRC